MRRVITDTSCLIVLSRIGKLFILKSLYGEIWIPEKVKEEFGEEIEDWIKIRPVKNKESVRILEVYLDPGESEVISTGLELRNSLLVLDDLKARNIAKHLELSITGTLGIILKAKEKGIISSVKVILEDMKKSAFRVSSEMEKELLKIANEK